MADEELVVDAARGAGAAALAGDPVPPSPETAPRDELAFRLRQQELLAEMGLLALKADGIDEILRDAVRLSAEGLGAEMCKYLEHREAEGDLLVRAGVGWSEGVVGAATLACDDASPAGYAWRMERAVLSNHLGAEDRFRTPELLRAHGVRRAINVPVKDGGRPYGVLEADSRSEGEFTRADLSFLQGMANVLSVAISRQRKERELEAARGRSRMVEGEMRHRVKKLFAAVRALIALTRREAQANGTDALALLSGRIEALRVAGEAGLDGARGCDSAAEGGGWVDPAALVAQVLAPFGGTVRVRGAAPDLPSGQAGPLSLIVHELATNAARHGALSAPEGRVDVDWRIEAGEAVMDWREAGGPPPDGDPPERGFGTRLMDGLAGPSGARIERRWRPEGLHATVTLTPAPRPDAP